LTPGVFLHSRKVASGYPLFVAPCSRGRLLLAAGLRHMLPTAAERGSAAADVPLVTAQSGDSAPPRRFSFAVVQAKLSRCATPFVAGAQAAGRCSSRCSLKRRTACCLVLTPVISLALALTLALAVLPLCVQMFMDAATISLVNCSLGPADATGIDVAIALRLDNGGPVAATIRAFDAVLHTQAPARDGISFVYTYTRQSLDPIHTLTACAPGVSPVAQLWPDPSFTSSPSTHPNAPSGVLSEPRPDPLSSSGPLPTPALLSAPRRPAHVFLFTPVVPCFASRRPTAPRLAPRSAA